MRKRNIVVGLLLSLAAMVMNGQGKYLTESGQISFFSHTVIEDIRAENQEVSSVIDASTGEVAVILKMTDFQFPKKLMQEHFNENYVESEKFPKATFSGRIRNNDQVDYSTEGTYKVQVEGELTIHGISNEVEAEGTIELSVKGISARTKFMLNPEEFGIKIPKVVRRNIAEKLEITVEMNYQAI